MRFRIICQTIWRKDYSRRYAINETCIKYKCHDFRNNLEWNKVNRIRIRAFHYLSFHEVNLRCNKIHLDWGCLLAWQLEKSSPIKIVAEFVNSASIKLRTCVTTCVYLLCKLKCWSSANAYYIDTSHYITINIYRGFLRSWSYTITHIKGTYYAMNLKASHFHKFLFANNSSRNSQNSES